ncbi:EpsG family protein [Vibrio parahaemolyticus]|uniref:EpsG family protein n=1 Tax=Vibrio parahaemolyticus TaxID=670 RepID=UPI00193E29EA|nr:EpsG family protein [Vibrio parahaemolyticus]EIY8172754.1 EpsG family protein [Vibrio parahaemolyticus]EIY8250544.1 EpsG family protein [Vibrio parahaemolyticus]ELA8140968.1 EpsG family protein [Vibrio parahaemolyticus]MBM4894445.1 EpsG family protein [Vibrio parahaemolyticus]MBM4943783.1 EpsG family protein [Vibrio parahaemolyticus]
MPYFTLILIIATLFLVDRSAYNQRSPNTNKNIGNLSLILYVFSCFIIFVFFGFRGDVNTDWIAYKNHYDGLNENEVSFGLEMAFWQSMLIAKKLGLDYTDFIAISVLLDILLISIAVKDRKNKLLLLLLYLIFSGGLGFRLGFNLQRNIKSILLFFISIKYLESKDFLRYLLVNLLGALFHSTSLIYIPLYFFFLRSYPTWVIFSAFLIGNIIYLLNISWMSNIINIMSPYLPGRLVYLSNVYLSSDTFSQAKGFSSGYIERVLMFALLLRYHNVILNNFKYSYIHLNILYLYFYLQFFGSELVIIPDRFALLFLPGFWLVFCELYDCLSKKRKYAYIIILLIYTALKHFMIPAPDYIHYESVIFNDF